MMNKEISFLAVILAFTCLVSCQQTPGAQNLAELVCEPSNTKPSPETKKYSFENCIVAQVAAYLSIGDGKYIPLNNGTVNSNQSACEKINASTIVNPRISLKFDCAEVTFIINHTNDSKTFVAAIEGSYTVNTTKTTFTNSTPAFSTTQPGHYYKCNAEQAVIVKPNTSLVISNFAFEAYRTTNNTDFYQIVEECSLDSQPVSDLVRIGVGVCLIALVAIVLIAYFIGRRRWSERSSYESV